MQSIKLVFWGVATVVFLLLVVKIVLFGQGRLDLTLFVVLAVVVLWNRFLLT